MKIAKPKSSVSNDFLKVKRVFNGRNPAKTIEFEFQHVLILIAFIYFPEQQLLHF